MWYCGLTDREEIRKRRLEKVRKKIKGLDRKKYEENETFVYFLFSYFSIRYTQSLDTSF